jgi:PAS domain S-box-containing protein
MPSEENQKDKLSKALQDLRKRFKEVKDTKDMDQIPGEYLDKYGEQLEELVKEQSNELETEKSERLRAQEALKKTEEKYRTLIESLNDIVYSADSNGNITYMSPQILKYGWMPEEAISKNLLDFVIPEDKEKIMADLKKTLTTGEEFPTQFRVKDRHGKIHWFEENGTVQHDNSGNIVGLTGVLRDITKSKKIEDALKKNEGKYRLLFESSPDSITIIDKNGIIVDINNKAVEISGMAKEELIGQTFMELNFLDEENLDKYLDLFTAFLEGEDVGSIEVNIKPKDGKEKWFEIFPSIIGSKDDIYGIQIISRDITAQKDSEN